MFSTFDLTHERFNKRWFNKSRVGLCKNKIETNE